MSLLTGRVHTYLLLLNTMSPIFNRRATTGRGGDNDTRPRLTSIGFIVGNYLFMLQCVVIVEQQPKAISSHRLVHILYIVGGRGIWSLKLGWNADVSTIMTTFFDPLSNYMIYHTILRTILYQMMCWMLSAKIEVNSSRNIWEILIEVIFRLWIERNLL